MTKKNQPPKGGKQENPGDDPGASGPRFADQAGDDDQPDTFKSGLRNYGHPDEGEFEEEELQLDSKVIDKDELKKAADARLAQQELEQVEDATLKSQAPDLQAPGAEEPPDLTDTQRADLLKFLDSTPPPEDASQEYHDAANDLDAKDSATEMPPQAEAPPPPAEVSEPELGDDKEARIAAAAVSSERPEPEKHEDIVESEPPSRKLEEEKISRVEQLLVNADALRKSDNERFRRESMAEHGTLRDLVIQARNHAGLAGDAATAASAGFQQMTDLLSEQFGIPADEVRDIPARAGKLHKSIADTVLDRLPPPVLPPQPAWQKFGPLALSALAVLLLIFTLATRKDGEALEKATEAANKAEALTQLFGEGGTNPANPDSEIVSMVYSRDSGRLTVVYGPKRQDEPPAEAPVPEPDSK